MKRSRFTLGGWIAAMATLSAMAGTVALAAPGAGSGEKEYRATFTAQCVLDPRLLDKEGRVVIETRALGPTQVADGEQFALKNVSATLTTPKAWSNELVEHGASGARGRVTQLEVNLTGAGALGAGPLNIARASEYEEGLPFEGPVASETPAVFEVPSGLESTGSTYSLAPEEVTGAPGGSVRLQVGEQEGFEGKQVTGRGIQATVSGVDGTELAAPQTTNVKIACTAAGGSVLGEIPIVAASTSTSSTSTETGSSASTTTTTTSTTITTTTTAPAEALPLHGWSLNGSLGLGRLGDAAALPPGCTFDGQVTIPGILEGAMQCPTFTAAANVFGVLHVEFQVGLTQADPVRAEVTERVDGLFGVAGTAEENLAIDELRVLGLTLPAACATRTPVVFALHGAESGSELAGRPTFGGVAVIPPFGCTDGGADDQLISTILTLLVAGPSNPYTLYLQPPR